MLQNARRTCRKKHPTFHNESARIFRHMWFFSTRHVLDARGVVHRGVPPAVRGQIAIGSHLAETGEYH